MNFIEPVTEAEIWLQSVLNADASVLAVFAERITTHPAPRDSGYPILTHFCLTPEDNLILVGGDIYWATLRFLIRGIALGDDRLTLRPGVAAMHAALHNKRGETAVAFIESCIQIRPFTMLEMADSIEYYHVGGEYQIKVRAKD